MHGSIGQLSVHDPLRGRELEGALARLVEAALSPHALAVQTSTIANRDAWLACSGARVEQLLPACEMSVGGASAGDSSEPDPVFRVVGRLQRWKGVETMAEALRRLGSNAPRVDWLGVDMPFGAANLNTSTVIAERYADIYGDRLRWLPPVTRDRVLTLQASALCNVIPSTWDVLNFTVIEAMASGRPVICSRGAGASELIEDGLSGLLFDAGDAAGLADAMQRMLSMPESERLRMAAAAREVVRQRLDPARNAAQRLEAYRSAIDAWQKPRPPLPAWLAEAVSPEPGPPVAPWPVLDNLPLKGLLAYTGKRLARKLMRQRAP
jgi:glycosyltransferase involved in cell wall biosynthesis